MGDANQACGQADILDPARINALFASLGMECRLSKDDPLPPFTHHIYFWNVHPPESLGRDGHPQRGIGLIPDLGLPRRMWAGGDLEFVQPLLTGHPAEKRSTVSTVAHKKGRSGPLAFVTLEHEIWQNQQLCVREKQDLVYREDHTATASKPQPPLAPPFFKAQKSISFDTTLLFRYSALTFNGHRIHYDIDYARHVEGYDGLVVHGPLLAQMLMIWIEETVGPLSTFAFRTTAPLLHFEHAMLCIDGQEAWVQGPDGRLCLKASFVPK